jgi:hypothetical protein
MIIYETKHLLKPMYGRGIGDLVKNVITGKLFKKGARKISNTALNASKKYVENYLGDSGLGAINEFQNFANKNFDNALDAIASTSGDIVDNTIKTQFKDSVINKISNSIDKNKKTDKKYKNLGDAISDDISNAKDKDGKIRPNASKAIEDVKVIKKIPNKVFEAPKEKEVELPKLSSLLYGAGSKKRTGKGLILPGQQRGYGIESIS